MKSIGDAVIEAVIQSGALQSAVIEKSGMVFVWSANAAEQIEAALTQPLIEALGPALLDDENMDQALAILKVGVERNDPQRHVIRTVIADFLFRQFGFDPSPNHKP